MKPSRRRRRSSPRTAPRGRVALPRPAPVPTYRVSYRQKPYRAVKPGLSRRQALKRLQDTVRGTVSDLRRFGLPPLQQLQPRSLLVSSVRDALPFCKERPDPNIPRKRGGGGGPPKSFIPWCKGKR